MAELFFKKYTCESFQVLDAGTKPAYLNPIAVHAMRDVGIDLSAKPNGLTSEALTTSFRTISMGCIGIESCPAPSIDKVDDWNMPDLKGEALDQIRVICIQIESKVKELAAQLEK